MLRALWLTEEEPHGSREILRRKAGTWLSPKGPKDTIIKYSGFGIVVR